MKLNIAIVEDSQENIDTLKYLLEKSEVELNVVGIAKTTSEAALLLSRPDIDLAFLDIQLKEGTIFNVLEDIVKSKTLDFEMVFVTAHGSYENALKAIQYACLDFINKPIDKDELLAAVDKVAGKKQTAPSDNSQVKYLLELIGNNVQQPKDLGIILSKGVIEFVPLDRIQHFEADQSICRVFLEDGKKLTSAKHLGYYIQLLSDNADFIQSSKSHLINFDKIKQYDHRERTIKFSNGEHLIASHRFSKDVRKNILERQNKGSFLKDGWGKMKDLFS